MSKRERLLIVGGVAAGMSAAAKARRVNPELEIVVFEKTGFISYGACGFPYFIKGDVAAMEQLIARTPAQAARQGIDVRLCHEVESLDLARQTLRVRDLAGGKTFEEPWDRLILATGAAVARPPLPGIGLPGVFSLRTVEDALAIRRWLDAQHPAQAVIVGGGYISLEMAEALAAHGAAVSIVELQKQIMPSLDPDVAELVQAELTRQGVAVFVDTAVTSFIGASLLHDITARVAAALEGQSGTGPLRVREVQAGELHLPADMVINGLGARPAVWLAREAGLTIGPTGAIAVDERQQTSAPNVWAAGAAAEVYHRVMQQPAYMPSALNANKQGRVAGTNAAGGQAKFAGSVGTAVVKVFDLHVGHTGLTEKAARTHGFTADSTTIQATTRAHYMPGHGPIHVKLVYERGSQRLLGAQIVGSEGVAKRVDVIAAALQAGWTTEELADLDTSYAPPFAPVWDALLVAANVANKG